MPLLHHQSTHGGVGGATNAREQLHWKLARAFIAELLDDVAHGVLYVGMEPRSASGASGQHQLQRTQEFWARALKSPPLRPCPARV